MVMPASVDYNVLIVLAEAPMGSLSDPVLLVDRPEANRESIRLLALGGGQRERAGVHELNARCHALR
jgi:hypothetical protein